MAKQSGPPLVRVTTNLLPRAAEALETGRQLTDCSITDFVNRAVQAYAYMEEVTARGADILIREKDGEAAVIKFM